MPFRSDDTDELDDREWPDPDQEGEGDGEAIGPGHEDAVDTVPCPFCKARVYDNAEWCPHCRNYLFYEGQPAGTKPWWLVGGVAVSLLVVLYWILRG
jgi:hypothetical protein